MPKRARSSSFSVRKVKRSRASTYRRKYPRRAMFRKKRRISNRKPRGFPRIASKARWSTTDFPAVLQKKFTWTQNCVISPTNAGGVNLTDRQVFVLNDLFDPNGAAGISQWSVQHFGTFLNQTLYHRFRVMGTKVNIQLVNSGIYMVAVYMLVGDVAKTDDLPLSSVQSACDKAAMLPQCHKVIYVNQSSGGGAIKRVSFYVNPWKVAGVSYQQYMTNDDYAGTYNGSPLKSVRLNVSAISMVPNTGTYINCQTNLVYYARLDQNQQDPATVEPPDQLPPEDQDLGRFEEAEIEDEDGNITHVPISVGDAVPAETH